MAKIASETRIYRETKKFLNEVIYVIKDFRENRDMLLVTESSVLQLNLCIL